MRKRASSQGLSHTSGGVVGSTAIKPLNSLLHALLMQSKAAVTVQPNCVLASLLLLGNKLQDNAKRELVDNLVRKLYKISATVKWLDHSCCKSRPAAITGWTSI